MATRLPSPPPVLPGFAHIRALGTGGFSDVFLYEQDLPRREVAVKVMLTANGDTDMLKMFHTEADALARLSAHPSILSVFGASRAADGRPYLVMEHCPSSYATVYRDYILSLQEVLDVGVRMAGALESVHRAGLLHRDVKPSNILRTVTGAPVLSDFGVATTRFFTLDDERVAMSIPWSAPEVVSEEVVGSVASDIWSLGATLFSLLAGKSPFELDGEGVNAPDPLMRRIRSGRYTVLNREDVPEALDAVLAQSLSLRPGARQASALQFGEQLQQVQRELGLRVTDCEVLGEDTMTASVASISRTSSADSRLPEAISVSVERRPRRPTTSASDSASSLPVRRTDEVPGSEPRQKRLSTGAIILAGAGGVALIVAILVVTLGR